MEEKRRYRREVDEVENKLTIRKIFRDTISLKRLTKKKASGEIDQEKKGRRNR